MGDGDKKENKADLDGKPIITCKAPVPQTLTHFKLNTYECH